MDRAYQIMALRPVPKIVTGEVEKDHEARGR